jgi:hypothetical protein
MAGGGYVYMYRQVDSLKHGAKNMNDIYICINWTILKWQNTALNQATG